jgi:tetratricopeptide (TPR) repeat protein
MQNDSRHLIGKILFSAAILLSGYFLLRSQSTLDTRPAAIAPPAELPVGAPVSESLAARPPESQLDQTEAAEARFWSWDQVLERLNRNPSDSYLNLEVGLILMEQKKNPLQAIRFLETALQVDPANQKAAAALVEAYAKANRLEAGHAFIDTCLETHPSHRAELLTAKADLQYQQAEFFEAKKTLEEAADLNPHDETTAGLLGLVYTTLGDERGMPLLEGTRAVEHRTILISRLIERSEWAEAERLLQKLPDNPSKVELQRYLEESRAGVF